MRTTRWEPFVQINRLRHEMDRLFDRWSESGPQSFTQGGFPPLNLWEDDDSLFVEAELPGFVMDDLEILITGGKQLSLKGERKSPELEKGSWHRRERGFGRFHRLIDLPSDVDSEAVSAEFHHGVLRITLPKREEVKPRKIDVQVKA